MGDERDRRIKARAFEIWQQEGSLDGRSLGHWLQAEKDVDDAERSVEGASPSTNPSLPTLNGKA